DLIHRVPSVLPILPEPMVPIFNGEPVVAAWPNKTLGKIPKPGPKAIIARVAQKTRRVQVKTLRCFITGFLSIVVDTSASCHRCLREAALFTWSEVAKLMYPPLLAQAAPAFALATGHSAVTRWRWGQPRSRSRSWPDPESPKPQRTTRRLD